MPKLSRHCAVVGGSLVFSATCAINGETTIGWAPAVPAATQIPIVATATAARPMRRSLISASQER